MSANNVSIVPSQSFPSSASGNDFKGRLSDFKSRPVYCLVLIVSLLFGFAYMLTPFLVSDSGNTLDIYRLPIGVAGFLFFFCIADYAVKWYRLYGCQMKMKCSNRRLFCISFLLVFFVGVFWLLIYYPGVGMYDSVSILSATSLGVAKQHPWFYCLLIQWMVQAVFFFGGGYEAAFVVESLIQITIAAAVSAHCVTWLKSKGVSKIPLLAVLSVYAFCPILNLYTISLFKDVPFAYVLVEWVMLLYDYWESKGESLERRSTYLRVVVCLILSLLRNNGLYISAALLVCMLILYRKKWKKLVSLFLVLGVVLVGSISFEKANSITHLFKETVGIPLQQIAAAVSRDGEITEEQLIFIDQVIPIEFIQENYNPYSADTLKWGGAPLDNSFLNENKVEFLQVWAEMLIPNFKIYVKAYLQATYGFWATSTTDNHIQRYNTIYVSSFDEWFEENDICLKGVLPESLQSTLETITYAGTSALGEGQLFWIFVFLLLLLILLNRPGIWIVGMPSLCGWLTIMVSTPVAYQWRYTLYIALTIPLVFGMLLIPQKVASAPVEVDKSDSPPAEAS